MLIGHLKIALKNQAKIIIIFFLTILLPTITLSIFGIEGIINESFRLAQKLDSEHERAANYIKTQISTEINSIDSVLQKLVQNLPSHQDDYSTIKTLIENQFAKDPLVDQVFIIYRNQEIFFPLFQAVPITFVNLKSTTLPKSQMGLLKKAEEDEYKNKNYSSAITHYKKLYSSSRDGNIKAQMLHHIARNLKKSKQFKQSIIYFDKIIHEYPQSNSSSYLPLALIARLEVVQCYKGIGDFNIASENALNLYEYLLENPWNLNEDQFRIYSTALEETISELLSNPRKNFSPNTYQRKLLNIKNRNQKKLEQWKKIDEINTEIIPEIKKNLWQSVYDSNNTYKNSKTIGENCYLFIATIINDSSKNESTGILGITLNNTYLQQEELVRVIGETQFSNYSRAIIYNTSGNTIYGGNTQPDYVLAKTSYFKNNFPPWKIEFYNTKEETLSLYKSFYFWTILTCILILIFGGSLIIRTIVHELEINKIKSGFVSSVSHELQTPLTSIKALTERLLDGKVNNQEKAKQYYSIIAQDTERLNQLVKNVLDFSKIDEGKEEYEFVKTDIKKLVLHTIEIFNQENMQKDISITCETNMDVPYAYIDKDAIMQAINNLLNNAIKFSSENKKCAINIKTNVEYIIIDVKDEGIGIPLDELDSIFDKFYQGKYAHIKSVKGTGLGLTLVKHIIEAHGGKIIVKSKIGEGSTFSIFLPVYNNKN